jgi:hypothetical protein
MAEDQGYNGDVWNKQACVLLGKLGWTKVGDYDIDIEGEDNKDYGIDSLFKYIDVRKSLIEQGVILESKRYKTTSFRNGDLQKWINRINTKINKLKHSQPFSEKFPEFNVTSFNNGIILIWFSNHVDYIQNRESFINSLTEVKLSKSRTNAIFNRIYVLENNAILKLCSIIDSMEKINRDKDVNLEYYYPTSDKTSNPIYRSNLLTIDYMFSKFILAEGKTKSGELNRIVFYFGNLEKTSFQTLYSGLNNIGFIDYNIPLAIYTYERSDQFRKILPDLKELFSRSIDNVHLDVEFKEMEVFGDLPTFLREIE